MMSRQVLVIRIACHSCVKRAVIIIQRPLMIVVKASTTLSRRWEDAQDAEDDILWSSWIQPICTQDFDASQDPFTIAGTELSSESMQNVLRQKSDVRK